MQLYHSDEFNVRVNNKGVPYLKHKKDSKIKLYPPCHIIFQSKILPEINNCLDLLNYEIDDVGMMGIYIRLYQIIDNNRWIFRGSSDKMVAIAYALKIKLILFAESDSFLDREIFCKYGHLLKI